MKKLLNPFFEESYDGFGAGIMEPIINLYSDEWILKRIQHNAKAQKLHIDLKKVIHYISKFPEYRKQDGLFKISYQVYLGELKEIFKRIEITQEGKYTKEETAEYLGVKVRQVSKLLAKGILEKLKETRGPKKLILITGESILKYKPL